MPASDKSTTTNTSSSFDSTESLVSSSRCWGMSKCCLYSIVACAFLGTTTVALSIVYTGNANPMDYFVTVDPPGQTEAIRWNAESGLTLIVENAMDESYVGLFDKSVVQWNASSALDLKPRRVEVDPECNVMQGRLRICNSDYGETMWRGINVAILDSNEHIMYSTAKINDRHMNSVDQKVYTICHELGHGFGLPHTDENHFNRDRGDCMDYTERPQNNDVPGEFNLNLLVDLYGTPDLPLWTRTSPPEEQNQVGSGSLRGTDPPLPDNPFSSRPNNNKGKDDKKEKDDEEDGEDRYLQQSDLQALKSEVDAQVAKCQSEYCSYKLHNGYRMEVNMMLA